MMQTHGWHFVLPAIAIGHSVLQPCR